MDSSRDRKEYESLLDSDKEEEVDQNEVQVTPETNTNTNEWVSYQGSYQTASNEEPSTSSSSTPLAYGSLHDELGSEKAPLTNSSEYQSHQSHQYHHFPMSDSLRNPQRLNQIRDGSFAIFFGIHWFFATILVFLAFFTRITFEDYQLWRIWVGIIHSVIWSALWLFLLAEKPFVVQKYEKYFTVVVMALSAVALAYGYSDNVDVFQYILYLWFIGVVRIFWGKFSERAPVNGRPQNDDWALLVSTIQSFKPLFSAFLPLIVIVLSIEIMWIVLWSFAFAFATLFIYDSDHGKREVITNLISAQTLLLLVLLWTMSVFRSIILSVVGSVVNAWYTSGGKLNTSSFITTILSQACTYHFGSVVFAGTVVDVFSVVGWFSMKIHFLLYNRKDSSVFLRFSKRLQSVANTSSYTPLIIENETFLGASKRSAVILRTSSTNVIVNHHNTLRYVTIFIGLQTFAIVLSSSGVFLSAVIAFILSITVVGTLNGVFISLVTCYGQDPIFMQSNYPDVAGRLHRRADRAQKEKV